MESRQLSLATGGEPQKLGGDHQSLWSAWARGGFVGAGSMPTCILFVQALSLGKGRVLVDRGPWGPGLKQWEGCKLGEPHAYASVLIPTTARPYIPGAGGAEAMARVLPGSPIPIASLDGRIRARCWEISFLQGVSWLMAALQSACC